MKNRVIQNFVTACTSGLFLVSCNSTAPLNVKSHRITIALPGLIASAQKAITPQAVANVPNTLFELRIFKGNSELFFDDQGVIKATGLPLELNATPLNLELTPGDYSFVTSQFVRNPRSLLAWGKTQMNVTQDQEVKLQIRTCIGEIQLKSEIERLRISEQADANLAVTVSGYPQVSIPFSDYQARFELNSDTTPVSEASEVGIRVAGNGPLPTVTALVTGQVCGPDSEPKIATQSKVLTWSGSLRANIALDFIPPEISTLMGAELFVTPGSKFPITGTASDENGIAKIILFEGAVKVGEMPLINGGFSFDWLVPKTVRGLKIVAIDNAGNQAELKLKTTVTIGRLKIANTDISPIYAGGEVLLHASHSTLNNLDLNWTVVSGNALIKPDGSSALITTQNPGILQIKASSNSAGQSETLELTVLKPSLKVLVESSENFKVSLKLDGSPITIPNSELFEINEANLDSEFEIQGVTSGGIYSYAVRVWWAETLIFKKSCLACTPADNLKGERFVEKLRLKATGQAFALNIDSANAVMTIGNNRVLNSSTKAKWTVNNTVVATDTSQYTFQAVNTGLNNVCAILEAHTSCVVILVPMVEARLFNIDDNMSLYIGSDLIRTAGYQTDTGFINISDKLKNETNAILFSSDNTGGPFSWGMQLRINGEIILSEQCNSCSEDNSVAARLSKRIVVYSDGQFSAVNLSRFNVQFETDSTVRFDAAMNGKPAPGITWSTNDSGAWRTLGSGNSLKFATEREGVYWLCAHVQNAEVAPAGSCYSFKSRIRPVVTKLNVFTYSGSNRIRLEFGVKDPRNKIFNFRCSIRNDNTGETHFDVNCNDNSVVELDNWLGVRFETGQKVNIKIVVVNDENKAGVEVKTSAIVGAGTSEPIFEYFRTQSPVVEAFKDIVYEYSVRAPSGTELEPFCKLSVTGNPENYEYTNLASSGTTRKHQFSTLQPQGTYASLLTCSTKAGGTKSVRVNIQLANNATVTQTLNPIVPTPKPVVYPSPNRPNSKPIATIKDITAELRGANNPFRTFIIAASDPDGDPLMCEVSGYSFVLAAKPLGICPKTFDLLLPHPGTYAITLKVLDPSGAYTLVNSNSFVVNASEAQPHETSDREIYFAACVYQNYSPFFIALGMDVLSGKGIEEITQELAQDAAAETLATILKFAYLALNVRKTAHTIQITFQSARVIKVISAGKTVLVLATAETVGISLVVLAVTEFALLTSEIAVKQAFLLGYNTSKCQDEAIRNFP